MDEQATRQPTGHDPVLDAIRNRLLAAPECAPECVLIERVQLTAQDEHLRTSWRVIATHASGWKLPRVEGGELRQARVDGQDARYLGTTQLRLEPGIHRIDLDYHAHGARISIRPPSRVMAAEQNLGAGWAGGSIADGRLTGDEWLIERAPSNQTEQTQALPAGGQLDSFVRVERTIQAAIDVRATTRISRIGRPGRLVVRFPVISGERMQSARTRRDGAFWIVELDDGEDHVDLNSVLEPQQGRGLSLVPIDAEQGIEEWKVEANELWTVDAQGVPQAPAQDEGALVRRWLPLPGERLQLVLVRLPVAKGATQRIDRAIVRTQVGPRQSQHTLELAVTATQAGSRELVLPETATDIAVLHNGQALTPAIRGGRMTLPVMGGSQSYSITFRTQDAGWVRRAPTLDLGGEAGNLHWHMEGVGERGWILATGGAGLGAAVLYWAQLLALLGLAWVAARVPGRMTGLREALLLALGFSTFNATGLLMLVIWRVAVWMRETGRWPQARMHFNLAQVGLVAVTGVALLTAIGMVCFGLLGEQPDMLLRAPSGLGIFEWYLPSSPDGPIEGPWILSAPLWLYRTLLLGWAIWFAHWLVREVRRAFQAWRMDGYWRERTDPPSP